MVCGCNGDAADGVRSSGGSPSGNAGSGAGSGSFDNPTGDCPTPASDGFREWIPDCETSLAREYYKVSLQDDGTAYMLPRPDGLPYMAEPCAIQDHELHAIAEQYLLCESATEDTLGVVNSMDLADALAVAHYLSDRHVFVAGETGVWPYAQDEDVLEACQTDDIFRNGPMKERCDFLLNCAQTGACPAIGWVASGEQAVVLAAKMNEMYGIEGEMLCDRLTRDARETLDDAIRHAGNSCQVDEDCAMVGRGSQCHDSCEAVLAAASQSTVDDSRVAIDESTCAAFTAAQCPAIVHPPCVPLRAGCVDGICVEQ